MLKWQKYNEKDSTGYTGPVFVAYELDNPGDGPMLKKVCVGFRNMSIADPPTQITGPVIRDYTWPGRGGGFRIVAWYPIPIPSYPIKL